MIYRLASKSDLDSIARIYYESGKKQSGGFIHCLGIGFIKSYLKIHLNEIDSIVLVAVDESGSICGFVSGTKDAENHLKALRKNCVKLIIALIPSLMASPALSRQLISRYDFICLKNNSEKFGITTGPRIDYWAWNPLSKCRNPVFLLRAWLNLLFSMNICSVKGEIDRENVNAITLAKLLGAREIETVKLKDGRTRLFIEFVNMNLS